MGFWKEVAKYSIGVIAGYAVAKNEEKIIEVGQKAGNFVVEKVKGVFKKNDLPNGSIVNVADGTATSVNQ